MSARELVRSLLKEADIEIDGSRPSDLQVHNEQFYRRVLMHGSLGLGESYMDGWWDAPQLDAFFAKLLAAHLDERVRSAHFAWQYLKAVVLNTGSRSRAFRIGEAHYDTGNDLYAAMLGTRMVYTCGYWKNAQTLDEAQEAKLDLTCRKLGLEKGMRLLDIGCGWGSLLQFAAEQYGVSGVGITVSKEQAVLARERCKGLPIEIRLQDYRATNDGPYDRIASLGMFEHVGVKNYRTYFACVRRLLKDDGLFLLHTIGGNFSGRTTDPWIEKYIFPGSMLPSAAQTTHAAEGLFTMEDWHNFGADYDRTLMAWYANASAAWSHLPAERYDERFRRLWSYYLLSCAATFRVRGNQLWQIVYSKNGVPGGYVSIR